MGVIVGGGGYGPRLAAEIRRAGYPTIEYSWTPFNGGRRWVSPTDLDDVIKIFLEDGVTDLLHAGTFSVAQILLGGAPIFWRPATLAQVFLTRRGMRGGFFQPYDKRLETAGLRLRTAPELFDAYRPVRGAMGQTRPLSGELPRLARLKAIALGELARRDSQLHLPQAVIFDDEEPVHWERWGTDRLCRQARLTAKGAARRTLVKILPPGMPPMLDPPTIGTHTVVEAKAAGVDVIALDTLHGLIIDRTATAAQADAAGIVLCGI